MLHVCWNSQRIKHGRLDMKKAQLKLSFFHMESGSVLLSRAVSSQVPSALKGLTSVFGMGTGGTLSPLSPEFSRIPSYPENRTSRFPSSCEKPIFSIFPLVSLDSQIFLDQVLDRLVSASFICYHTFTADLSPGSLPGVLLLSNGILILEVGFTLRCLQRLSRPHFASQLCPWQDNCCTSDASTPVLSY